MAAKKLKDEPVYCDVSNDGNGIDNNVYTVNNRQEGTPAVLTTYDDGSKYLFVMPGAFEFSWDRHTLTFQIKQFKWDTNFNRWATLDTGKFNNSSLAINNNFMVRPTDGKAWEELTEDEKKKSTPMGEFAFWHLALGHEYIVKPVLGALIKKLNYEPPTVPLKP